MKQKLKVGSLFSGIGGIDLAFLQAGFEIAWANEIDRDACSTYKNNFKETNLIQGDIKNLNPDYLENVDILTAGFPCQPFSVCGNKKGFSDKRGNLFFEIMRFADAKSPSVIFLENVANLTEHDSGRTFGVIHDELVSRNYYIRYLIADACEYGLPQHRTRTYILAFKDYNECNSYAFPEKSQETTHILDVIDTTVKYDPKEYLETDSEKYKQLNAFMTDNEQVYRFSDYGIQASKDGISFTLKANMGTWFDRVPYIRDNYGIRTLTPNECALLQGFPKDFSFENIPKKSAYKQIGNSVCVPLVYKIAKNIIK